MYTYIYIYTYIHIYIHTYVYIRVCLYIYISILPPPADTSRILASFSKERNQRSSGMSVGRDWWTLVERRLQKSLKRKGKSRRKVLYSGTGELANPKEN